MDMRVVVEAPAKVNLHLQVLGKRPDVFHYLLSLFQAVSLCDTLDIRLTPSGEIRISGEFDCPAAENTILRASRAFLDAAGSSAGLDIRVRKRIPAGAGLGGGSSDAAAALKALNLAFGGRLSPAHLANLAVSVGSDVPFFLGGPCAIVSGRGEVVEAAEARSDYFLVVLFPGFPSRTAEAYAAVDTARSSVSQTGGTAPDGVRLQAEYRRSPGFWTFRNDFYDALAPGNAELRRAMEAVKDTGAQFSGLTGSGSAVFGVYGEESAADRAATTLNEREGDKGRWIAEAAAPLARMPVPRLE